MDFKNTVLIMTSNLGTRDIAKGATLGFTARPDAKVDYDRMRDKVMDELKRHFRPEFLNRIDEVIVFHQLSREEVFAIVDLLLRRVVEQLKSKDIAIELTDNAKAILTDKGYDPALGARPLRRTIQRLIEDPLSEKLLWKEFKAGDLVVVDAENGEIIFRTMDQPTDVDVPPAELAGKE